MCAPIASRPKPSPRETADAATVAFNAHDLASISAVYRPDVVLVTPDSGELKGREEALEYFRGFMQGFPDGKATVAHKHDAGETLIDEWVFHGTNSGALPLPSGESLPPTGRRVSVRGVDIVTVKGGGVASHRIYFDQVELLTQLGLMSGA